MILVFLGPPGSGKGTQAKMLAEKLNIPHIALGDILREEVRAGSEIGLAVKEMMNTGKLVPDEITIKLAEKRTLEKDCAGGFILDGYPRSDLQAQAFDKMLASRQLDLEAFVYFSVSKERIIKRLSQRRSCKSCGAVYHLTAHPPKVESKCDLCGGELYQRHDDEEGVIRTRFEVYEKQTKPLADHYAKKGKFFELDADGTINEVFERLLDKLKASALVP